MKCERCGATPNLVWDLMDYCAKCGKNMCKDCMAKGCCGQKPAQSGNEADDEEGQDKLG